MLPYTPSLPISNAFARQMPMRPPGFDPRMGMPGAGAPPMSGPMPMQGQPAPYQSVGQPQPIAAPWQGGPAQFQNLGQPGQYQSPMANNFANAPRPRINL